MDWDVDNIGSKDEDSCNVIVEYPVEESGGHTKSLDYLFRPEGFKHFTCEAKKPIEELDDHAWQAKKYAFSLTLDIATLTDFEEFYIYVVSAPPKKDKPAGMCQYFEKTNLDFNRAEMRSDNDCIESLKGQVWAECLNAHVLESVEDA